MQWRRISIFPSSFLILFPLTIFHYAINPNLIKTDAVKGAESLLHLPKCKDVPNDLWVDLKRALKDAIRSKGLWGVNTYFIFQYFLFNTYKYLIYIYTQLMLVK